MNSSDHGSRTQTLVTEPSAKISMPQVLIASLGMMVSLYTLVEHLRLKFFPGATLACDISEKVSCSTVFSSKYGDFMGIPLGALGLTYFGVVMALAILPKFVTVSEKWIAQWRLLVTGVGAVIAGTLAYLSYFELQTICPACSTVHGLTILGFLHSLVSFLKVKGERSTAHPTALAKLVSTALALGVPPILAGVILPLILPSILATKSSSTPKSPETAAATIPVVSEQTPFPDTILSVSKSNFVGKGEDYRKGNDDAKVVVQKFADYECPHCQTTARALTSAVSTVGADKVLYVYRNYPLSNQCNPGVKSEMHKHACNLALATRCAGQQGKFWEYHDWAFDMMDKTPREKDEIYALAALDTQAEKFGMDKAKFSECMVSKVEMPKIQDDISVGNQLGLTGTPLVLINGKKFAGNPADPQALVKAIQNELSKN